MSTFDNQPPEQPQKPKDMTILLVQKEPLTMGSRDITYDVSIATVNVEGEILDTRSLGSTVVENPIDFSMDIAKAIREKRPDINEQFKAMEQVATHILSQIPEEEFFRLVASHQGAMGFFNKSKVTLKHHEYSQGDTIIAQAAQWKGKHQKTAFDMADEEAFTIQPARFGDNPFFDPKEHLFAQARNMLADYVRDASVKEKLRTIDYFDDHMRALIHEAVNESMPQNAELEQVMQQLGVSSVETVAELVEVAYHRELTNLVPTWTSCYDMAAKEVLQNLMPKILNYVTGETEEITTWQQVQSRCAASALSPQPNEQGEYPSISFSQAMNDAAREVGCAERTHTQTYEHTSRKMLQDAFMLGTVASVCEQSQRVLPSINFMEDGLLVLFPSFSEEAQRRQASHLSAYDTEDLITTLPNIMNWLMLRVEQSQGLEYGAHSIVDDLQRLLHVFDEGLGLKLVDPETSEAEIEVLNQFKIQIEQACEHVDALRGDDALFQSQEWRERLLGHILMGAPKDVTVTRFLDANFEVKIYVMNEEQLTEKAKEFTLRSQEIDDVRSKAPAIYQEAFVGAQMQLYQESLFFPVGISQVHSETQKLTFTSDYFLLPSQQDELNAELSIGYMKDMPFDRLAEILAYNLLEVMEVYKATAPEGAKILLDDEMRTVVGETISERIGTIKWYAEHMEREYSGSSKDVVGYGIPKTRITDASIDRGTDISADALLQEAYRIAVNREVMTIEDLNGPTALIGKFFRERFFDDIYDRIGVDVPTQQQQQQRAG